MAKLKEDKDFKPFGTDINKDETLGQAVSPEGEPIGFYKGQQVDYDVILDEMEERTTRNHAGKTIKSRKLMFSGIDFKKLKQESEI